MERRTLIIGNIGGDPTADPVKAFVSKVIDVYAFASESLCDDFLMNFDIGSYGYVVVEDFGYSNIEWGNLQEDKYKRLLELFLEDQRVLFKNEKLYNMYQSDAITSSSNDFDDPEDIMP